MTRPHCVITTIQPPTDSVRALHRRLIREDVPLIVVGDRKGPPGYGLPKAHFLSLDDQLASPFDLARVLPTGHYARKNVGYLQAVARGAPLIYETDDDNAPLATWTLREPRTEAIAVGADGWVNAYRYFTDESIWPRGFPLDEILPEVRDQRSAFRSQRPEIGDGRAVSVRPQIPIGSNAAFRSNAAPGAQPPDIGPRFSPVQQGLADNSPDVDAVWRLVMDRPVTFQAAPSVYLPPGCWCPFNSQSTWWWPAAYALLYLPSHCSFRMTDIWRGFVAQRCLWEMGCGLVFHGAEVFQDRNAHDLMRDFEAEIPGYRGNKRLAAVLAGLALAPGPAGVAANLEACYAALVAEGFFPAAELDLVRAWKTDLERAGCR